MLKLEFLKNIKLNYFVLFWIISMLILYRGIGLSPFILLCFLHVFLLSLSNLLSIRISKKYLLLILFLLYYFFISVAYLENVFDFLIKYFMLPYIVYYLVPNDIEEKTKSLIKLKNFIGLTAIFGLIEYLLHYNFLANFVIIDSVQWLKNMNISKSYFPSSIFLHYTYFGYVLLVAFIIACIYPYKNRVVDNLFKLLLTVLIFVTQSRIIWIALFFLTIILFIKKTMSKNVERKTIFSFLFLCAILIIGVYFNIFDLVANFFIERFSKIFEYGLKDGSLGQRFGTLSNWGEYANLNFLKSIFGTGYSSISDYLKEFSFFSNYSTADSIITVFLVETGILGIILFIFGFIQLLYSLLQFDNKEGNFGFCFLLVTFITSITIDFSANPILLSLFYYCLFFSIKGKGEFRIYDK